MDVVDLVDRVDFGELDFFDGKLKTQLRFNRTIINNNQGITVMTYLNTILSFLFVAFLVTGCGSPKDASKSNFKRVLNDYYANHCIIVDAGVSRFPVVKQTDGLAAYGIEKLNALADAGMLTVRDTVVEKMVSFGRATKNFPAKVFDISEKGKKFYAENSIVGFGTYQKGFCAGTLKVDEVTSFTEPNNFSGFTVSNVNVKSSPKKVHNWVKDEGISEAFPRIAQKIKVSRAETHPLILMDKGWMHYHDFQIQQ